MTTNDDVVVFGGAGFIGRHLVNELKNRVRSITIVSRRVEDGYVDDEGIRYRKGDLQNLESVNKILKGSSVVYDLSLPIGATWEDFEERSIECVKNLATIAKQHSLRRVIYTSTSDALFLGAKKTITEKEGTDSKSHLRNYYSRGKSAAEKVLFDLHQKQKLPVVVFRPFLVVGRGKEVTHGGIGFWMAPNCLNGWGRGNNPQPFVLVQDVAKAMAKAIEAPDIEGQAFNLAGDVFISAREYVRLIAQSSKRNFRYYSRNLILLWISEMLTSTIKRLVGKKGNRQTYRDMISSSKRSFVDCSAAKRILGWKPNASLKYFKSEAINSYFEIQQGDLRLEVKPKN